MKTAPGHDDWYVITAGFRLLIQHVCSVHECQLGTEISESDHFDLILFDTPPILVLLILRW